MGRFDFLYSQLGENAGMHDQSGAYLCPLLAEKFLYDGRHDHNTINGVFFDAHVEDIDSDSAWQHKNLAYSSPGSMFSIVK